eukprot:CAMPEP_0181024010 /NCGR_PEP_ID=MMETSP1070-20121207/2346_1 /TAXON_ID=265543 /ORGANISM="Minutocellus polymorphus, Strain NH13" /LENGTH=103 /DNA_ID=CAMNT_0023101043 /DNA_START=101 /DNA_END=412 /DNA_ORIENTATION=+
MTSREDSDSNPSTVPNGSSSKEEETHRHHRMFGVFPRLHRRKGHSDAGLLQYAKDSLKKIGANDAHWRPRHQTLVGKNCALGDVRKGEGSKQIKQVGPTTQAA